MQTASIPDGVTVAAFVLGAIAVPVVAGSRPAARQTAPTTAPPGPGAAVAAPPPAAGPSTTLPPDANGNPMRVALRTGHISNYDEAKVGTYTLPDPLVLANGHRVDSPRSWTRDRRPEILREYESTIFGQVPATAPKVMWTVVATDPSARGGAAVMKTIVGTAGSGPGATAIHVTMYTPAHATRPVPLILALSFGGGPAEGRGSAVADPPVAAEILARGWGYATVGYQDIQPDRAGAFSQGVIGLSLRPGQSTPANDEWGSIAAWAWGASRVVDYLDTDPAVDGHRIALQGFSRLGKAALWASATDDRIAALFSACAGEMGSALSRRDWGETVDDMAQNFPWQFAGAFQQWPGRWQAMPGDAHMLIALSAPRPVFLTGGTADQWSDPKGEFLAEVAAGPVYRLLGKQDLGTTVFPSPDTAVISGDLGWYYHTGPHGQPAPDWRAFLDFLGKYFH